MQSYKQGSAMAKKRMMRGRWPKTAGGDTVPLDADHEMSRSDREHYEWHYGSLTPLRLGEAASCILRRYGKDIRLIRNDVGNLSIHREDGEYLGWIDLLNGEVKFSKDELAAIRDQLDRRSGGG